MGQLRRGPLLPALLAACTGGLWRATAQPARPVEPPPQLGEVAAGEAQRCREAQPRWDALWKRALAAEPLVSAERRPFYRAHVLAMIAISKESNRILALTAEAVQQAGAGSAAAPGPPSSGRWRLSAKSARRRRPRNTGSGRTGAAATG